MSEGLVRAAFERAAARVSAATDSTGGYVTGDVSEFTAAFGVSGIPGDDALELMRAYAEYSFERVGAPLEVGSAPQMVIGGIGMMMMLTGVIAREMVEEGWEPS